MKFASLSRPWKWAFWLSPLLLIWLITKFSKTMEISAVAQTSPDAVDASLRSRIYDVSWVRAMGAAQSALSAQRTYGRRWKIGRRSVSGTPMGAHLTEVLRVQVPVLIFIDDLEVTLREEEEGRVRVDVRSASRFPWPVQYSDLGENRRHVRQFLSALDAFLHGEG